MEDLFFECLRAAGRGITYGPLIAAYAGRASKSPRTAKTHLKMLVDGIEAGRVRSVGRYRGPEGWLYGTPEDEVFLQAKGDAERKPRVWEPTSRADLGGAFQGSPVRSEWTICPVSGRTTRTTVLTLGVADFMECPLCDRVHFLGVNPKMKDQRVYAWQIDPLACSEDYADALTRELVGDPVTFKSQPPAIQRVRDGGHYVGLRFRNSWEYDPDARLAELTKANRRVVRHKANRGQSRTTRMKKARRLGKAGPT